MIFLQTHEILCNNEETKNRIAESLENGGVPIDTHKNIDDTYTIEVFLKLE